jgi:hypothetical protein
MSIKDRIKAFVFEEESGKTKEPVDAKGAAPAPDSPPNAPVPEASQDVAPIEHTAAGLDVPAVEEHVDHQIQSNPAFAPVVAFLKMAESMKNVIGDEKQRFQAAQAATSTPTDALLTAVKSYSSVLQREAANFEQTFVAQAQSEIQTLSEQEKQLGEQIGELQAQLSKLSAHKEELGAQSIARVGDLAKARIDFGSVSSTLNKRYSDLAAKLQQHLGGAANGQ